MKRVILSEKGMKEKILTPDEERQVRMRWREAQEKKQKKEEKRKRELQYEQLHKELVIIVAEVIDLISEKNKIELNQSEGLKNWRKRAKEI